jgi:hypothetical protein
MRDNTLAQRIDAADLGGLSEDTAGANRGKGTAVLATPAIFTAGVVIGMTVTLAAGDHRELQ